MNTHSFDPPRDSLGCSCFSLLDGTLAAQAFKGTARDRMVSWWDLAPDMEALESGLLIPVQQIWIRGDVRHLRAPRAGKSRSQVLLSSPPLTIM